MSDESGDNQHAFDGATEAPQSGIKIPISVDFGNPVDAQYTTTQYNRPVKIDLDVEVTSSWEDKNDGHHWMQLTVWLDGDTQAHYFSGEQGVTDHAGQVSTLTLPSDKKISWVVPAGKQHLIRIRHENDGAKALAMKVFGTVTGK